MNGFKFGLEAEFFLAQLSDYRPLWYKDYTFKTIDQLFSKISLDGIPPLDGLAAEPPHEKLMPFIVEGYGVTDENFLVIDALPKGIEIRTPVCNSLEELFTVYETLFSRVKNALKTIDMVPVALSHHPTESKFIGPQNKRRHDFWLWAMEVMTTYGPDINVSFPKEISDKLFFDIEDLENKVNYYAPALAALSLNSPFVDGKIWSGKSYRTYKRSIVAPAIELHPDENFRIEFKVFEMTNKSSDFLNYFHLVLALFLTDSLKERASKQDRIYELGIVAKEGLHAKKIVDKISEIIIAGTPVLKKYGFNPDFKSIIDQLETKMTPSDHLMQKHLKGTTLLEIYQEQSKLYTLKGNVL